MYWFQYLNACHGQRIQTSRTTARSSQFLVFKFPVMNGSSTKTKKRAKRYFVQAVELVSRWIKLTRVEALKQNYTYRRTAENTASKKQSYY